MSVFARESGIVKEITNAYARHSGVVKPVQEIWARKADNSVEKVWPTIQVVIDGKVIDGSVFSSVGTNTSGVALAFRFGSDGTIKVGNNTNGTTASSFSTDTSSPWIYPPSAGVGSGYEILFTTGTVLGDTPSFSLARNTWFSLTSDVTMSLSVPTGLQAANWTAQVQIREGTTVLGTANIEYSLEIQ